MIQRTRPVAASRKWLMMSGGLMRFPAAWDFIPPRASQMDRSTKPPPAVSTQVINAAHFTSASLLEGSVYL
jgi:hypothetical protein